MDSACCDDEPHEDAGHEDHLNGARQMPFVREYRYTDRARERCRRLTQDNILKNLDSSSSPSAIVRRSKTPGAAHDQIDNEVGR